MKSFGKEQNGQILESRETGFISFAVSEFIVPHMIADSSRKILQHFYLKNKDLDPNQSKLLGRTRSERVREHPKSRGLGAG